MQAEQPLAGLPSAEAEGELAPRRRYRLAALLLISTFLTTTTLGGVVYEVCRTDTTTDLLPLLSPRTALRVWASPELLGLGLAFSIPLLVILLSHELGHYLACRYYGVPATLPYFIPAPFFIGTFGAFIRIRGRIENKTRLFDIGLAGPAAGFAALLPFLVIGVALSEPALVHAADRPSEATAILYRPGNNLAFLALGRLLHGPLPEQGVLDLHPFALAAWVGLLATALNLLPLGQLDGGHILYAAAGRWQRLLAWPLWLLLCVLGLLWQGWLVWAFLVLWMGLRHPPVASDQPLDGRRRRLAWAALLLLALSFTPRPLTYVFVSDPPGILVQTGNPLPRSDGWPVVRPRPASALQPRSDAARFSSDLPPASDL